MIKRILESGFPRPLTLLGAAIIIVVLLAAMVSVATADDVYHSQHIAFHPVGDQPLRSGFLENIHANGPQVYAVARYVLNGASPNAEYYVQPLIYLAAMNTTGEPLPFPAGIGAAAACAARRRRATSAG